MSTSIKEQIAAAVLARLLTVTTGNGYEVSLSSVTRPDRKGKNWVPTHLAARLVQGDSMIVDDEEGAVGFLTWEQDFVVRVYASPPESSTEAIDTVLNAAEASIWKAVMTDPRWTAGPAVLALDTRAGDVPSFDGQDGTYSVRFLTFTVLFRHRWNDPYSQ